MPQKTTKKTYHHGDLRAAILKAGEELLREKGVDGFSLRAVARMAEVSPAAPAHHFKSITGIFSSLAARGFAELDRHLHDLNRNPPSDSTDYLELICMGYLEFAQKNSALFRLMFDCEKLDWQQEDLRAASSRSLELISTALTGRTKLDTINYTTRETMPSPEVPAIWAIMHGFAHLLIGGQLDSFTTDNDVQQMARACLRGILDTIIKRDG